MKRVSKFDPPKPIVPISDTNMKYLDGFVSYLRDEKRYSENTITAYRKDIENYLKFIEKEEFGNADEVSERVAEFYTASLRDEYIPRSIARKTSSVRAFYVYYVDVLKEFEVNPFTGIVLPKVEKKLPKFVYDDEVKKFLSMINTQDDIGKRDKLIFEFLYGSGLRVSELTALKMKEVDPYERRILVHGKGSKDRIVPMTKQAAEDYKTYIIIARPTLLSRSNDLENDTVFLNFHGGSLTSRGVRDILNRVLNETESEMRVSPHAFRHSFATHLLNNGMDVRMVQELLGHSNLSTTQIYTKLSKEALQEQYNKSFPKGKDKDK